MNKITYEIKLEKSVKIILGVFAVGVLLNAFSSPIAQELFGIKNAFADWVYGSGPGDSVEVWIKNWPAR